MHEDRIVFSQVMDLVPLDAFRKCVRRYDGERRVRTFSCWDQFLCMAFAQLTYRESLRDNETCLRAVKTKLYHAGIGGRVAKRRGNQTPAQVRPQRLQPRRIAGQVPGAGDVGSGVSTARFPRPA